MSKVKKETAAKEEKIQIDFNIETKKVESENKDEEIREVKIKLKDSAIKDKLSGTMIINAKKKMVFYRLKIERLKGGNRNHYTRRPIINDKIIDYKTAIQNIINKMYV